MDETTVHSWQRIERVWQPRMCNFSIPIPRIRTKGFTVIGAISDTINLGGYFEIADATKTPSVCKFFRNLATKLTLPAWKKPYLVIDNHSSHTTQKTVDVLQQYYHPLFLPPCSSPLSSVEFAWKLIKAKVKKMLLEKSILKTNAS